MTGATLAAQDRSGVSPTSISLPSGPGSIEGLGESFEPQLNSGTFNYQIPLRLPSVRGQALPELGLEYNSGNGNGSIGLGWRLKLPVVQRQTDRGLPDYTDADTFIETSGEELVRLADGSYRMENEFSFTRFEKTPEGGWKARLASGMTFWLGETAASRLGTERSPSFGGTFLWMIERAEDLNGNRIRYEYTNVLGQLYLSRIEYGLHRSVASESFRVEFAYDDQRPDSIVDYRPRFRSETVLRLNEITVFHGPRRLRTWKLDYDLTEPVSLLKSVRMFGDARSQTNSTARANEDFLPPILFDYSKIDLNADPRIETAELADLLDFGSGRAEFCDINHDGLPDIVLDDNGVLASSVNPGFRKTWAGSRSIENPPPGSSLASETTRFVDLRGDGRARLLVVSGSSVGETLFSYFDFRSPTELSEGTDFSTPNDFLMTDANVRFVDLNMDKAMDLVRIDEGMFGGISGLLNGQTDGKSNHAFLTNSPRTDISFRAGWQLADMNGDRMQDLVLLNDSDNTLVCLNSGLGGFVSPYVMSGGPEHSLLAQGSGGQLADLNQDGLADLVVVVNGGVLIWRNSAGKDWAAPITIEGPQVPDYNGSTTSIRFVDINGNGSTDLVWSEPNSSRLFFLDIHPTGKAWLLNSITNTLGGGVLVNYRSSVEYMLQAVGTSNEWTSVAPFPVPVVSEIVETDGRNHRYTSQFTYRNAYYDGKKKEFRGFERAVKTELGDESHGAPSLITDFRFDTGAQNEALKGKPLSVESMTAAGGVFFRQTNQWVPRLLPLLREAGETRAVTFAFQKGQITQQVELGPETKAVTLEQEFNYDDFGNQIFAADYGIVTNDIRSALDDERVVTTEFAINTNAWILRHPKRMEIKDENGAVISRSELFYDDETFSGGNFDQVSVGILTMKRDWVWPATNTAFIASSRAKYDPFGNPTLMLDPLAVAPGGVVDLSKGHVREVRYDPELHTFPISETIYVGSGNEPLVFQGSYDLGLGVLTNSIDFNANATFYAYDTFGRLTNIVRPGDSFDFPTSEYIYRLRVPLEGGGTVNFVESRMRDKPGTASPKESGFFISRNFIDGLGRPLMTKAEAEAAPDSTAPRVVVSGATTFNARQKPELTLNPFFSMNSGLALDNLLAFEDIEAPGWRGQFHEEGSLTNYPIETAHGVRMKYDAMLRPKTVINADGSFSGTEYQPLRTILFDENDTDTNSVHFGTPMVHHRDGLGRTVAVDELARLTDDGAPTNSVQSWRTHYAYDLQDQMTRIVDSQRNEKEFRFDGLKRKVWMNDPNRGEMRFVHDDASNLLETTDAKKQRMTFTYDGANRILTEDYHDESAVFSFHFTFNPAFPVSATNRPDVAYFYDRSVPGIDFGDGSSGTGTNTKGRLAYVWDLSGEEHSSFDARGRAHYVVKRIHDPLHQGLVSFRTSFEYDSADRMTNLVYPDNDAISYQFNDRNLLARIGGGTPGGLTREGFVIPKVAYVPWGQPSEIGFGNGVRTAYSYDARLRLKTLRTAGQGAPSVPLISFGYEFDSASNVRRINDDRPASLVPAGQGRRNTQIFEYDDLDRLIAARYSFAEPGEPDREDAHVQYRYDRIGNMLQQNSTFDLTGNTTQTAALTEMESGGASGRWNRMGRTATDPPGPHALSSAQLNAIKLAYPYDGNGNMSEIDGLQLTWDFKDRLVVGENKDIRAEYSYDFTDRRIQKRVFQKTSPDKRPTTVSYINQHFEIRENEAPTKFIWNGGVRVARFSGSLSSTLRLQRIRIYPGWNLLSLAVSATNVVAQLAAFESIEPKAIFRWDQQLSSWNPVTAGQNLPAGEVLWLRGITNATLSLVGVHTNSTNRTIAVAANFLANASLDPWNMKAQIQSIATAVAWMYDARFSRWISWLPPPLKVSSAFPEFIAPAEAIFFRAESTVQISLPDPSLQIRYYHQDHASSSSCLSDANGALVEESAFFPFGSERHRISDRTGPEAYKFSQKERDAESGLSYFEARYLNTDLGRFASVDVAAITVPAPYEPQTLNPYSYAANRPLTHHDPDGEFISALITVAIAAYDTYQYASGNINGADYAGRMALNATSLAADVATGGAGGGLMVRTAALAARGGIVAQGVVKGVVAADRLIDVGQGSVSAKEALESKDWTRFALSAIHLKNSLGRGSRLNPTPNTAQVDQYALKAVKDGFYPVMKRGFAEPQGGVWLKAGDVWKYGTTKNPTTRYSNSYLSERGLRYERQSSGTLGEALSAEKKNIMNHLDQTGELPAGNKIIK